MVKARFELTKNKFQDEVKSGLQPLSFGSPSKTILELYPVDYKVIVYLYLSDSLILSSGLTHQYRFFSQPLTWTAAQAYCRQTHADLATVENSEELGLLMDTLQSAGYGSDVWIGLYSEIDWKWSDAYTGTGADYRHWRSDYNEPDFHYSIEFCVMFAYYADWYDVSCSDNRQFVCYKG
uniref:C-type lectin domain-containing protein n=1 Tax=Xiphophorus couchianus TaxID=32473 RepID=A0A3B5LBI4_9TELE